MYTALCGWGLQTVSSLERCPLFRVCFIERSHCTQPSTAYTLPPCRTRLPQEANSLEHSPAQNSTETSKEEGLPVEVTEAFTEFEFLNNEDGNDSSDDGKCNEHGLQQTMVMAELSGAAPLGHLVWLWLTCCVQVLQPHWDTSLWLWLACCVQIALC